MKTNIRHKVAGANLLASDLDKFIFAQFAEDEQKMEEEVIYISRTNSVNWC